MSLSRLFSRGMRMGNRRVYDPVGSILNDLERMLRWDEDFFPGRHFRREPPLASSQEAVTESQKGDEAATSNSSPQQAAAQTENKVVAEPRRSRSQVADWNRWDPWANFGFPSVFRGWEPLVPQWANMDVREMMPNVDVVETEKEYKVALDLPGVKKEDIKIKIGERTTQGRLLTISAERKDTWAEDSTDAKAAENRENAPTEQNASDASTGNVPEAKSEQKQVDNTRQRRGSGYSYARFSRSFLLPEDAEVEKAQAKHDHGVLRLTIPKMETVPQEPEQTISIQ